MQHSTPSPCFQATDDFDTFTSHGLLVAAHDFAKRRGFFDLIQTSLSVSMKKRDFSWSDKLATLWASIEGRLRPYLPDQHLARPSRESLGRRLRPRALARSVPGQHPSSSLLARQRRTVALASPLAAGQTLARSPPPPLVTARRLTPGPVPRPGPARPECLLLALRARLQGVLRQKTLPLRLPALARVFRRAARRGPRRIPRPGQHPSRRTRRSPARLCARLLQTHLDPPRPGRRASRCPIRHARYHPEDPDPRLPLPAQRLLVQALRLAARACRFRRRLPQSRERCQSRASLDVRPRHHRPPRRPRL